MAPKLSLAVEARTFLVIDDEEVVRKVMSRYFKQKGHRVLVAASGEEALETLQQAKVDMIFLDIKMPTMDGLEVLRRLHESNPQIPVIMVTAVDDIETARQTIALGARDYIKKPIDLDYLDTTATWAAWVR